MPCMSAESKDAAQKTQSKLSRKRRLAAVLRHIISSRERHARCHLEHAPLSEQQRACFRHVALKELKEQGMLSSCHQPERGALLQTRHSWPRRQRELATCTSPWAAAWVQGPSSAAHAPRPKHPRTPPERRTRPAWQAQGWKLGRLTEVLTLVDRASRGSHVGPDVAMQQEKQAATAATSDLLRRCHHVRQASPGQLVSGLCSAMHSIQ